MTVHFEGLDWQRAYRAELKRANKLQERLNRIAKFTIGNARIWQLDRLAMECEVEADTCAVLDETVEGKIVKDQEAQFRADALFIRRLEWDLGELHVAVKGDTNRRGGRYDQSLWRGPRP